eukprot:142636-Chlamydomonas_euryale.AAC.2
MPHTPIFQYLHAAALHACQLPGERARHARVEVVQPVLQRACGRGKWVSGTAARPAGQTWANATTHHKRVDNDENQATLAVNHAR